MKKRTIQSTRISVRFLSVLCVAAFAAFALFAACERPDPEPEENPTEQIVLVDGLIPFSEINSDSTGFGWTNIPYDNQVILINDTQTFLHYADYDDGYYPEINFDSNSVVLWSGWVGGGSYFEKAVIECVNGVVHIELFFQENLACVASEPWIKAFLLPKIPANTTISAEVHIASI